MKKMYLATMEVDIVFEVDEELFENTELEPFDPDRLAGTTHLPQDFDLDAVSYLAHNCMTNNINDASCVDGWRDIPPNALTMYPDPESRILDFEDISGDL